ncbi:cytochrome c3 family protein [Candidatus Latescibacterota bacterium]
MRRAALITALAARYKKTILLFLAGVFFGIVFIAGSITSIHLTGGHEFCMSCHEMRIVGEQGWMHSIHYRNSNGIIADCKDCHIPPELAHMLWTKARDGSKDIFVHLFGISEPTQMNWEHLRETARSKISDSSCEKCHSNITDKGVPLKAIVAHRAAQRMNGRKRCVDCHLKEFHGNFKEYLFGTTVANNKSGGKE